MESIHDIIINRGIWGDLEEISGLSLWQWLVLFSLHLYIIPGAHKLQREKINKRYDFSGFTAWFVNTEIVNVWEKICCRRKVLLSMEVRKEREAGEESPRERYRL